MSTAATMGTIRRWLLGLLVLGLAGTTIELILLAHYEDSWQLIPLFLIAIAGVVLVWHAAGPSAVTVRALQLTMGFFVIAGGLGIILHFQGSLEFQREIDPSQSSGVLFWKALHAKAPPVLAPGLMTQLGLLGLAYCYRHPALSSFPAAGTADTESEP